MESQVTEEVQRIVNMIKTVYSAFGLGFEALLSTRPEQRLGDDAAWDRAEGALQKALEATGLQWKLNPGDGAFYGPKIDFVVTDSLDRKWQTCTIQLDPLAPERFDLTYVGDDNKEHRPLVIHRAIYGSFERFVAILTEHYAGNFPTWLAPVQVRILPVTDRCLDWARTVQATLEARGLRVELDLSSRKLGAMIRDAQLAKIPYTVVIGDKEVESKGVAPRRHGEGKEAEMGFLALEAFVEQVAKDAAVPY
jgi:threonyl-tRNA synthetase